MSKTIAILGGTGDLGTGLARRWAKAGHRVIIGSRAAEKAQEAAALVEGAEGMDNLSAATAADKRHARGRQDDQQNNADHQKKDLLFSQKPVTLIHRVKYQFPIEYYHLCNKERPNLEV